MARAVGVRESMGVWYFGVECLEVPKSVVTSMRQGVKCVHVEIRVNFGVVSMSWWSWKPEFRGMRSKWKMSRFNKIKLLSRSLTQKRRKMTKWYQQLGARSQRENIFCLFFFTWKRLEHAVHISLMIYLWKSFAWISKNRKPGKFSVQ